MDNDHDHGFEDPVGTAERYLSLGDVSDEDDGDAGRKRSGFRPPKWFRPMRRLPAPRRMALIGLVVVAVAAMSISSLVVSHRRQQAADRDASACSAALTSLTDALTARQAQTTRTRGLIDMDTLRAADPESADSMSRLLKQPDPDVMDCDSDAGAHAAAMKSDAARIRRETRRLATLTEQATSTTGAYETRRAQTRFDATLAQAERLSDTLDPDSLSVPYLKTRLDQEIDVARNLPRTASTKTLEQQTGILEDLMAQLGSPVQDTKGTEEEHAAQQ